MHDSRHVLRVIMAGFAVLTLLATSPCDLLCFDESIPGTAATTSHCGDDTPPQGAPDAPPCGDECPGCDLELVSASAEDIAKRAPTHAWADIVIARQRSLQLPGDISSRMLASHVTTPLSRDILALTSTLLI